MKMAPEIFLSYASLNKATADALVKRLETDGFTCWIAPRDVDPGRDYAEEIVTAIRDSKMFIFLFSSQANTSKHVLREVDRAIGFEKVIVPIRIDSSKPTAGMDYRLCTVQWIDAGGTPIPEKAIREALAVLAALKRNESAGSASKSLFRSLFSQGKTTSIITGSIHHATLGAGVVFDWDMRAAASLLSHFAAHDLPATLDPPLYSPELIMMANPDSRLGDYVNALRHLVCGKNTVVIGSADRNPLTEVLLGDLQGMSEDKLFSSWVGDDSVGQAFVAYRKEALHPTMNAPRIGRFFFRNINTIDVPARGFMSGRLPQGQLEVRYVSQEEIPIGFNCLAHLLIAESPYSVDAHAEYLMVLNGVNGPATFALVALLGGRMGAPAESVRLLRELTDALSIWRSAPHESIGIQLLIEATVTSAEHHESDLLGDNRVLSSCRIIPETIQTISRVDMPGGRPVGRTQSE